MRKQALESNHGEATPSMLDSCCMAGETFLPEAHETEEVSKLCQAEEANKTYKFGSSNNLHGEKIPPTSREAYKSQVGSRNTAFMSHHHTRMGFRGYSYLPVTHAPVRHSVSSLVPSETRREPFLWSAIGPWDEEMFVHICQEKCKLEPETTFAVTATCT